MGRRRMMLDFSSNPPLGLIFHAPLTSDGVDIIGNLTPTLLGSPSYTANGVVLNTGCLTWNNLPVDFRNKNNAWTIEYEVYNDRASYRTAHQCLWTIGVYTSGQSIFLYSPAASANVIRLGMYSGSYVILAVAVNSLQGKWDVSRKEKITWDGDNQFNLYLNDVLIGTADGTNFPTSMNTLQFSLGGGRTASGYSDAFRGTVKNLKIYNRVI